MTKKDYVYIAEVIKYIGMFSENDKYFIAQEFAAHFRMDNPKFNTEKFMTACGFKD
jgi:hypothetical protein